ncbi:hypothetical protein [Methanosarcina barkeri]|nr:hypothetical protein [Methanosarcina barkeri]
MSFRGMGGLKTWKSPVTGLGCLTEGLIMTGLRAVRLTTGRQPC